VESGVAIDADRVVQVRKIWILQVIQKYYNNIHLDLFIKRENSQ
jgi:hypothetical protein